MNSDLVIAVCGAGSMGAGIAQVAAQAGHKVLVLDQNDDALGRGKASVDKGAKALVKRGKLDAAEADQLVSRVSWSLKVEDLAEAGLTIEAIVEKAEAKQALYQKLEEVLPPRAMIATNTSSLSVTALARTLQNPERFLGLHFFNPAPVMKLVEVAPGLATDRAITHTAFELMERWRKVAVRVSDTPGFIVNRVARPFYGEGWRALEEGASDAATIDFLYRDLAGFRMGPFELGDLIGHDINCEAAGSVFKAYWGRCRFRPSLLQARFVAAGRLGRKSGQGVFDYAADAAPPKPSFAKTENDAEAHPNLPRADRQHDLSQLKAAFAGSEIEIDGVVIGVTDGRTARRRARDTGKPVAVLDWTRDIESASSLALAASCKTARAAALNLAARLGKRPVALSDRPGLVVFRTIAQIVNCQADAIRDQVAEADAIDKAMINGVNYPFGPMAWAKEYGASSLCRALDDIAFETGDEIYRPAELLRAISIEEGSP